MTAKTKRNPAEQGRLMLRFILEHGSITYDEALNIGICKPDLTANYIMLNGYDIFSNLTGQRDSRDHPEKEWYMRRQAMEQRKEQNQ